MQQEVDPDIMESLKQHSKNSAIKRNRSQQQMSMLATAAAKESARKR